MKDKMYKYGFLSVCGVVVCLTLYFAYHGYQAQKLVFAAKVYGGTASDVEFIQKCNAMRAMEETPAMKGLE